MINDLLHFIEAGGWVMYPLLFLSIAAVTVMVERVWAFKTLAAPFEQILSRSIALCEKGQFAEAYEVCRHGKGAVAACLATVANHADLPVEDIERYVQEVADEYMLKLERNLTFLDTTTTLSPLLGLLGTILGMIGAFRQIAASKSQGANDSILAGVGEALYATATGICVAVVCFIAYNYFSGKVRSVTVQAEQSATKMINAIRLYQARHK